MRGQLRLVRSYTLGCATLAGDCTVAGKQTPEANYDNSATNCRYRGAGDARAGDRFSHTFLAVLGFRFFWGLVAGLVLSVGATHIARLYSSDVASGHQGVYGGMLSLGGAFGFLFAPTLVVTTGGIGVHALEGLFTLPAIGALYRNREERLTSPVKTRFNVAVASVLTNPVVVLASLCYVAAIRIIPDAFSLYYFVLRGSQNHRADKCSRTKSRYSWTGSRREHRRQTLHD